MFQNKTMDWVQPIKDAAGLNHLFYFQMIRRGENKLQKHWNETELLQ